MTTRATTADGIGGAHDAGRGRDPEEPHIGEGHRRIAYCECGAQLVGDSRQGLFDAAEQHVAHHHPELLGALELDIVMQMAEHVTGIDAHGRPGA